MAARSVFILLFLFCAVPAMAEPVHIKINTQYDLDHFHTEGVKRFAKLLSRYSKNSVKISIRHGGAMGVEDSDQLRAVRDGELQMSEIRMAAVEKSEPLFGLSSQPFLVGSFEEAKACYLTVSPFYQRAAAAWNQKILYVSPSAPIGLFSKGRVDEIRALAGLKIGTDDLNMASGISELRAEFRNVPWYDVGRALDDGELDAVLTAAEVGVVEKFWKTSLNYTRINYSYPLNMVTINLDLWNSLNADLQNAILKAAGLTEEWQWQDAQTSDSQALTALSTRGVGIYEVGETLNRQLQESTKNALDEFMAGLDEPTRNAIRQCQAEI